jgi:uncharacterized protein (TIGR04255 family)
VQVRANGFSFNRLAPYESLDDYLPEIHNRWDQFQDIATPIQIRKLSLRYINRILIPLESRQAKLENYFNTSPQLPDDTELSFTEFLQQHQAIEANTANRVRIVMASQPVEASNRPVILDITAFREERLEPENWEKIVEVIHSLRDLKNRVFKNSLTPSCLEAKDRMISISFGESSRAAYAGIDGTDRWRGTEYFDGQSIPRFLLMGIERIAG